MGSTRVYLSLRKWIKTRSTVHMRGKKWKKTYDSCDFRFFPSTKSPNFLWQQRDCTTRGHQSFQILHLAKAIVDMTWTSMDENRRQTIDAFCGYLPIEPYRPYQHRLFSTILLHGRGLPYLILYSEDSEAMKTVKPVTTRHHDPTIAGLHVVPCLILWCLEHP